MYGGYDTNQQTKCELSNTRTPNYSWGTNFRFCASVSTSIKDIGSIDCHANADNLNSIDARAVTQMYSMYCSSGCTKTVWGSADHFTSDSSICTAARIVGIDGGKVDIKMLGAQSSYTSVPQPWGGNTGHWSFWSRSYKIVGASTETETAEESAVGGASSETETAKESAVGGASTEAETAKESKVGDVSENESVANAIELEVGNPEANLTDNEKWSKKSFLIFGVIATGVAFALVLNNRKLKPETYALLEENCEEI